MKKADREKIEREVERLATEWDDIYKTLTLLESQLQQKLNDVTKWKDKLKPLMKNK